MSREISDGLEAGEILVECGCAFYKLEDRMRALQQFQEATRRYTSYMHQLAVVYWMIGYVNWELGLQDKALTAWRQSMNRFEKLASQRFTLAGSDPKWYREVVKRLNTSIEYAVEHEMTPKNPTAAPRKR
jgi:tetratricopeptide (TPR) repeat protein